MSSEVVHDLARLRSLRRTWRGQVVLVPTMGALHHGHQALIRKARSMAAPDGIVVVSVFVNPLQFGPAEDLDTYPRDLDADVAICNTESVDVVFAPPVQSLYPREQTVSVTENTVASQWEGAARPALLPGALTVILKLINIVGPTGVVFGQKDAQQLELVRQMIEQFGLDVHVEGVGTVRDADGLAASSRNAFLTPEQRATALLIPRCLEAAEQVCEHGTQPALDAASAVLSNGAAATPPLELHYLQVVDTARFEPVSASFTGRAYLMVAATVGTTRLIDNAVLRCGADHSSPDAAVARRTKDW